MISRQKKNRGMPAEEAVLKLLSEYEPISHLDLMEYCHLKITAATERLKRLWDRKVIYISGWKRNTNGGLPIPFYSIGSLPDVPRPKALLSKDMRKDWVERLKVERPEKYRSMINDSASRRRKRAENDPNFAKKLRTYKSDWARNKRGGIPRAFILQANLDSVAIQFGITWRFQKTRRKAA